MSNANNKYKIAIIAPTPFYYQVPLFKKLVGSPQIDLMVYYCSDETIRGAEVEKTYHTKSRFVDPENLLEGYKYKFLKNYSPHPSFLYWPMGLINFGICKEVKNGNYDAVIIPSWANLTWWLALFTCLMFNTPVFLTTDTNISTDHFNSKLKMLLKRIVLGGLFFKNISIFLASGKANEDFYKSYGVPDKKMVRLPHWWGYEQFLEEAKKIKPERENLRKNFGIKKDDFVLLFAGRLDYHKNIFILLDAFKKVDYKNKKLFIVGDGPLRLQVESYIKDCKIHEVYLKGFKKREALMQFYNISDAFALPSKKEAWGMVVAEAMCFGLPIIVSDQVGARADLVKNGYNGFIFPFSDDEKLAGCIKKIIDMTPKERLIFESRSFEIISKWINSVDPVEQILKIMELLKFKNGNKK